MAQAAALPWVPVGEATSSHEAAERTPGNSFESRISNIVAASAPHFLQGLTNKGLGGPLHDLFPGTLFFQEYSQWILLPLRPLNYQDVKMI